MGHGSRNAIAALLVITAMSFYAASVRAQEAQSTLAVVEQLFLEGRYAAVVAEADHLLRARSARTEDLYYLKGLSELQLKRYVEARRSFGSVIALRQSMERCFDAAVGIGDAYFLEGETGQAIRAYDEALADYPEGQNASLVYYRLGKCYGRMGERDRAQYYYESAKLVAPLSFEACHLPEEPAGAAAIVKRVSAAGRDFSVQAGSFKDRDNALSFAERLAADGFRAYIQNVKTGAGTMYRVRIGRFGSREEAGLTVADLRTRGYPAKICSEKNSE